MPACFVIFSHFSCSKHWRCCKCLWTEMNQEIGQCVIEMLHQFIPYTFWHYTESKAGKVHLHYQLNTSSCSFFSVGNYLLYCSTVLCSTLVYISFFVISGNGRVSPPNTTGTNPGGHPSVCSLSCGAQSIMCWAPRAVAQSSVQFSEFSFVTVLWWPLEKSHWLCVLGVCTIHTSLQKQLQALNTAWGTFGKKRW